MLFSSPIFIFYFFPVVTLIYFCCCYSLSSEFRNIWLFVASFIFFMWGAPTFSLIILFSAILDWLFARNMPNLKEKTRRCILAFSLLNNLGILFYYKYTNFLLDNVNTVFAMLGWNPFVYSRVLLPIGVSFLVFEKITYTVDIYRGEATPNERLISYLTYVFLFPKVLAGPIMKYHEIARQLEHREMTLDKVYRGMMRFAYGLSKKVFLADTLGEYVDAAFKLPSGIISTNDAWIASLCFTFQIYLDFSAYSDMAIGMSRIYGFDLMENFNFPYISLSFTDFWRRWHISLSTWIRDYIYIPLGGGRSGSLKTYRNLWLAFLVSGIWHGANWTFVVWGIYHGFFIIIDRAFALRRKLSKTVNLVITFLLINVGWVIFRAPDVNYAVQFINNLFFFQPVTIEAKNFLLMENHVMMAFLSAAIISFFPIFIEWKHAVNLYLTNRLFRFTTCVSVIALFFLACSKVITTRFHPFIYFRF